MITDPLCRGDAPPRDPCGMMTTLRRTDGLNAMDPSQDSPPTPSTPSDRLERSAQLALVALLVLGCWLVLRPFFAGILFSIVIAVSSWPAYRRLHRRLGGRTMAASLIACVLAFLLAVAPAVLLTMSFADGFAWAVQLIEQWRTHGLPEPPQWLRGLPYLGDWVQNSWPSRPGQQSQVEELLRRFAEPAQRLALTSGRALGNAAAQLLLVALLLFFLYRDGERIGRRLNSAAERLGGPFARELLDTTQRSVVAVMFSIVGAAIAQATVAAIGFTIAGLPNPFLLAAATFVLSMVPVGPPLIWGGAAVWLFQNGETGWAVFMAIYGLLCISSIDNVVKPLIISHANHLPFVVTLMGVIGGLIAFGVTGIFIGPALLAVSINLTRHWLDTPPLRPSG